MYLIDFFKRLGRKANIPVIIYLVLNVFLIGGLCAMFTAEKPVIGFLVGLVLYLISLSIALSPVGEWMLRRQTGCEALTDPQDIAFLNPLFQEVYQKAQMLDPTIPNDVTLFISDDPDPNAFATGRKTVCVTRGLMSMPVEQIKATLGHEFGHLAHKDTDLILIVTVGNFIVTAIITFFKIVIGITKFICGFFRDGWAGVIGGALTLIFINFFMWVWTKIGTLLVMKSSRSNEFEADAFSYTLGYGNDLCGLLSTFTGGGKKGLFANLASSHPESEKRIERIQQMYANGVPVLDHEFVPTIGNGGIQAASMTYQTPVSMTTQTPTPVAMPTAAVGAIPQPTVAVGAIPQPTVAVGAIPQPTVATPVAPVPMAAAQTPAFCSGCGSKLTPGAKFCAGCGKQL